MACGATKASSRIFVVLETSFHTEHLGKKNCFGTCNSWKEFSSKVPAILVRSPLRSFSRPLLRNRARNPAWDSRPSWNETPKSLLALKRSTRLNMFPPPLKFLRGCWILPLKVFLKGAKLKCPLKFLGGKT